MNIPKNPMTFRQMYLGFRSGKKKIHPGSPVRNFGNTMRSDPLILGTPKRVKFEDSCGQKSSLGISNDLKLGQVLHTDDTKILAESCPDPTSWRHFMTSNMVKSWGDVTDDVIKSDVINLWRHRWSKWCHVRFFWKFTLNLVVVPSFVQNGWPSVIFERGALKPPPGCGSSKRARTR